MLANVGDRVRVNAGALLGVEGVFVGDRGGFAAVAFMGPGDDTIGRFAYSELTIIRPIITDVDRLELEVVKARMADLRRAIVDAGSVDTTNIATKLLLDLVPMLDLLPVPAVVRNTLKSAVADVIDAIGA